MTPAVACAALCSALVALVVCASARAAEQAADIDPQYTRVGFTLKTRWGQLLEGRFPQYEGRIETLADGRRRVRLRMSTREVEIVDHPNYTGFTRGEGFFEADRFPVVEFVSEPYSPPLIARGGPLAGQLSIREVTRRETFTVEPAACARPALDCDVVASGAVRRSDYGVDRWIFAVSDIVRFTLRLRLREATP